MQMNPFSAYLQLFEETTTKKASTDTDASLPSNKRTDHNIGQYYSKNFASSLEAKVKELKEANIQASKTTAASANLSSSSATANEKKLEEEKEEEEEGVVVVTSAPKLPVSDVELQQAAKLAITGVQTMWNAVQFVAKGTAQAAKALKVAEMTLEHSSDPSKDVTYEQAMAKISKSGQGLMKLGFELVREITATTTKPSLAPDIVETASVMVGTHRVVDVPTTISATLQVTGAIPKATASVTYRPTISLNAADALTEWGYTGQHQTSIVSLEQEVALDQIRDMAVNSASHVVGSVAHYLSQVWEDSWQQAQAMRHKKEEELAQQNAIAAQQRVQESFRKQENVFTAGTASTGIIPAYFLKVPQEEMIRHHQEKSPGFFFAN